MSMPPNVSTAASMTARTPSPVLTSASTACSRAGGAATSAMRCTAESRPARERAHSTTWHPSAASARALASPSPRLEPVTTAIFPDRPRSMACIIANAEATPMRWEGRSESGNVEDRRGMGGGGGMRMGLPVGGGIGGVVLLLVVSALTGTNPLDLVGGGGAVDQSGYSEPGAAPGPAATDPQTRFMRVVLKDTEDTW